MRQTQKYQQYLRERKTQIDQALERYLAPDVNGFTNTVEEGMHYAVCGGGKRVRPLLVLEGAALAGLPPETVMPAACSIELLHTYSLIHDDLPAMDNDVLRRGRPTCHVQFGEAMAILIGDALLTKAFGLLTYCSNEEKISDQAVLQVIQLLASAAGSRGMIGGQEMDLASETMLPEDVPLERLQQLKTGALFEYSIVSGAMLGAMPMEHMKYLASYAQNLGMVFQITDDILDVVGDQTLLGKNIGSDEKNHKTTYVSRYGLDVARQKAEFYTEQALRALEKIPQDTSFLHWFIENLLQRKQ